jgi:MinD-like ATPase involved in chromosome partitioning or flagellar assembly
MGVIAFFSAKGSPGTTTTALLAAALWPAPVLLVDADTEGGDVALRLRRQDGTPVDRSRGLLSLLPLARREMHPATLPEHAQVLRGGLEAVAGLSAPGQAGAAGHLWANLADAFARTTDRDVLLDCGRVTGTSVHLPLLQAADLVVCVLRPDVSGVVHARDRLALLQPQLVGPDGRAPRVGLVVVAERPRGRDAEGAASVLTRDLPGLRVLGQLAYDPRGAGVLGGIEIPRPERTLLVRSGRAVVDDLVVALRHGRPGHAPGSAPAALLPEAAPGHRTAARRGLRRRRTSAGAA